MASHWTVEHAEFSGVTDVLEPEQDQTAAELNCQIRPLGTDLSEDKQTQYLVLRIEDKEVQLEGSELSQFIIWIKARLS